MPDIAVPVALAALAALMLATIVTFALRALAAPASSPDRLVAELRLAQVAALVLALMAGVSVGLAIGHGPRPDLSVEVALGGILFLVAAIAPFQDPRLALTIVAARLRCTRRHGRDASAGPAPVGPGGRMVFCRQRLSRRRGRGALLSAAAEALTGWPVALAPRRGSRGSSMRVSAAAVGVVVLSLAGAGALAGRDGRQAPPAAARAGGGQATERPRLVVFLSVDQFRRDYIERYGARWTGGLARLLKDGAVFDHAAYPYFHTITCAGHATMSTGVYPATHGLPPEHVVGSVERPRRDLHRRSPAPRTSAIAPARRRRPAGTAPTCCGYRPSPTCCASS